MRARNFLAERGNSLITLKTKVKQLIDVTSDETLLNKIYTSLNSGTLINRLSKGLDSLPDREIHSFVDDIANAIIQAPGSYEEKVAFVSGLHDGFIDVEKMIDGNRHHFSDLLMPNKKVSVKFLFSMFNALKDLGGRAKKGPGEFAIAIMSPVVSVFGGGDLKIGNRVVEVKAGSGTIGATGYFQHSKVPVILQQYLPNINIGQNVGADALAAALQTANLDPKTLKEFAEKLVTYIFKAQEGWANTGPLKKAIVNVGSPTLADDIRRGYLTAAYSAYKGRAGGASKFDGVMLMDFDRQELRYFDDPEELYTDIDKVQFSFSSKNKEWGSKLINPGVKLRAQQLARPEMPEKSTPAALKQYTQQQAEYLVKKAQQRYPQDMDLRDPALIADVSASILDLTNQGVKGSRLSTELLKRFPILRTRVAEPVAPQTPKTTPKPALKVSQKKIGAEPVPPPV